MNREFLWAVAKRFLRAFIAGGIGQTVILLSQGVNVSSLADLKNLAITFTMAFVTGGLMALDKLIRYNSDK